MSRVKTMREAILDKINLHERYVAVFNTPEGQKVLQHICKVAYVYKPTFVKGDSHETALREGQRRLALSILRYVFRDHGELQKFMETTINESE